MTFEKAVELLEVKYEQAKKMEYVQKPLAWAFYQVWKGLDSMQDEKRREYYRIAQQKSRARKRGAE
jgi:hypothetical protein